MVGRAVLVVPFLACALSFCPSDLDFPGSSDLEEGRCFTVVSTGLLDIPWEGDWIRQADTICSNLFYRGRLAEHSFPVNLVNSNWSIQRRAEQLTLLDGCTINLNFKDPVLNGNSGSRLGNRLYRPCSSAMVTQFMQGGYSSKDIQLRDLVLDIKDGYSEKGHKISVPLICAYQSAGYSPLTPLFFRCDDKEFPVELVTCEHLELNLTCSGWDGRLGVCNSCMPGYTGRFCGSPSDLHGKVKRYSVHYFRFSRSDCSHMCPVRSSCVPTTNGSHTVYMCKCHWAYHGAMCQKKWSMCHLEKRCGDNAICIDIPDYYSPLVTSRTYKCLCKVGWGGPYCTKKINKCASSPCKHGGTCSPTLSPFRCQCPPAYTGTRCELDVNECRRSPCLHGVCSNTYGGFTCKCHPGYTGKLCDKDANECVSNPCKHGNCFDLINSYLCDCYIGFTGRHCEFDINECESQPCKNGGTCKDGIGEWTCECPPNVYGHQCQNDERPCSVNSCQAGGVCQEKGRDFECICPSGRTGRICEQDIDECLSKPCKNSGQCINQDNKYTCSCVQGFTGINCDIDLDECLNQDCGLHGTCLNLPGSFLCDCDYGYEGELCEKDIDDCLPSNPCQNGGICIDSSGDYSCKCSVEYTGKNCELAVMPCTQDACLFGHCVPGVPKFSCKCDQGFTGERCDIRMDYCKDVNCGPNAFCVSTLQNYSCQCNLGFTGRRCEIAHLGACDIPNVCHNGGTCVEKNGVYQCRCPQRFTGPFCDIEMVKGSTSDKKSGKDDSEPSIVIYIVITLICIILFFLLGFTYLLLCAERRSRRDSVSSSSISTRSFQRGKRRLRTAPVYRSWRCHNRRRRSHPHHSRGLSSRSKTGLSSLSETKRTRHTLRHAK